MLCVVIITIIVVVVSIIIAIEYDCHAENILMDWHSVALFSCADKQAGASRGGSFRK